MLFNVVFGLRQVEGGGRHPLLNVLAVMFIKGKVVLTGTLFKQVRKTPCRPRSWANFSLSSLYSH